MTGLLMRTLTLGAIAIPLLNVPSIDAGGTRKGLSDVEIDRLMKEFGAGLPKAHVEQIREGLKRLPGGWSDEQIEHLKKALARAKMDRLRQDHPLPPIDYSDVRLYNRLGARLEKPSDALIIDLGIPEDTGQLLAEVVPGTVAHAGGLRSNDVLVEIAGQRVSSDTSVFAKALQGLPRNTSLSAMVLRNGEMHTVRGIRFADDPMPPR